MKSEKRKMMAKKIIKSLLWGKSPAAKAEKMLVLKGIKGKDHDSKFVDHGQP